MNELARRVLVALAGIPIVFAAAYAGRMALAVLLGVMGAVGAWELFRMLRRSGAAPYEVFGIPIAASIPLYAVMSELGTLRSPAAVAAVVLLALLGASLWTRDESGHTLSALGVTALGAVYTGGFLTFAYLLRHHRLAADALSGSALLLYPVVLTWVSDIGGYFTGRWFGTTKLMPAISPGKTRAGSVGAVVATVAASVALNATLLPQYSHLALAPWTAGVFGLVISCTAQVGDLFESMLKREAGVKDSSALLPGHGGVLDRLDSLYFVLPVAYLLLTRLLIAAPVP